MSASLGQVVEDGERGGEKKSVGRNSGLGMHYIEGTEAAGCQVPPTMRLPIVEITLDGWIKVCCPICSISTENMDLRCK